MQWNMLARALHYNGDPKNSKGCDVTYDWENYRLYRTVQELVRYDSDIVCVQEADFYEEIKPYMQSLGYSSVFCPKYSSPCLDQAFNVGPDGPAIFYRLSMFEIVNMSCEKIILGNDITPQVYIILQLKHKPTGNCFYVVCLHLKSKVKYNERRLAQVKQILKALKAHLNVNSFYKEKQYPLMLCGDFNGEPFEEFYDEIKNDDVFFLRDVYAGENGHKKPTTIKFDSSGHLLKRGIDYIFYNPKLMKIARYLELPENEKLIEEKGLPNSIYSSDHLSLVCDVKFSNQFD